MVSSFNPFGRGLISRVHLKPDSLKGIGALKSEPLTAKFSWPNEADLIPSEVFGKHHISISSGFLVPGHATGVVAVINLFDGSVLDLVRPKKGFFYHRILWHDMNGDGRLDAITARARRPILGRPEGQLLWLEHPSDPRREAWIEHPIAQGPDVNFTAKDLDGDGYPEIIAAQFFARRLSVHWAEGSVWRERIIDEVPFPLFDLALADLNGDDALDLVVTNHAGDDRGAIFAYEIPAAFKTAPWRRHTLATGIRPDIWSFNAAAPGGALVVPVAEQKPSILLSGDGSGKVYHLHPVSARQDDWTYHREVILDTKSTIGQLALGDIDHDGIKELFVPAYDHGKIHVLSLAPD